jgi:hypothetical protein
MSKKTDTVVSRCETLLALSRFRTEVTTKAGITRRVTLYNFKCPTCNTIFASNNFTIVLCPNKCNKGSETSATARLIRIYFNMHHRVYNPKTVGYKLYGGRGITLCDDWRKDKQLFIKWALANGYANNLSIDRIDVDKGYYPENCRWSTRETQARNKSERTNNISGYRGVYPNTKGKLWYSTITVNSKRRSLGSFETPYEAHLAYRQFILDNNLEHSYTGRKAEELLKLKQS